MRTGLNPVFMEIETLVMSPKRAPQHSARYKRFLAALRQARKNAGLTQVEVAQKLRNHNSYISKSEKGERRVDVVELVDLCQIYGITVSQLLQSCGLESPPSN